MFGRARFEALVILGDEIMEGFGTFGGQDCFAVRVDSASQGVVGGNTLIAFKKGGGMKVATMLVKKHKPECEGAYRRWDRAPIERTKAGRS